MRRLNRDRALVAALATSLVVTGAGIVAAQGAQRRPLPTAVLRGDVLPGLRHATDLGPTPGKTEVLVGVVFAHQHAAATAQLEREIYATGSAEYHRFLTPAQFAARFGDSASAFRTAESWAERDGLRLARATDTHDYFTVSGTASQAERTFDVSLHNYASRGARFYANSTAPRIPVGLGITGVIGLNDLLKGSLPSRGASPKPAQAGPFGAPCAAVCTGLTTPQDLWSVYDAPTDNYGQGQSMAILGEGETANVISDLRKFEALNSLPQIPVTVVQADGPGDYTDSSGDGEWDIDTQASTGMAPEALQEVLYFGTSLNDSSLLDDEEAWVEDPNGPLQASMSIDQCEENPVSDATGVGLFGASAQYTEASEAALQQAVIEGRTLFNSTGDLGSSCRIIPINFNTNGVSNELFPVVNYPASSPNVVAVGGTVLYTDGTGASVTGLTPSGASRVAEYSWNFTGGGTSVTFPQPPYQQKDAAPVVTGFCLDSPGGIVPPPGTPCRAVPDIAAQSGDVPTNGYAVVEAGTPGMQGGGTSLSSPLSMGLWTRVNAAAPAVAGGFPGLGFANDTYYPDFKNNPTDFFDVGGGPTSPPNSNGYYASTPGDDFLSGLGVPDYAKVMQHVDGGTAPTNDVLPPLPSASPSTNRVDPCAAHLFTDDAGDDSYAFDPNGPGDNPQLDIIAGDMSVSGSTLTTTLTINNLSKNAASPGGTANDYYMLWNFIPPGGTTTTYFTSAEVDTTTGSPTFGDVTYADGTFSNTGFSQANTDTGEFHPGPDGTVVVHVKLANVGSPTTGEILAGPNGETAVLVGAMGTGDNSTVDTAGADHDFELGAVCADGSPTPTPSVSQSSTATPTPTPTSSPSSSSNPLTVPLPGLPSGPSSSPSPTPSSSSPGSAPKPSSSPSPSSSSSSMATPTPSPSHTSSPAAVAAPTVHVHRVKATRHHPAELVIIVTDRASAIRRLVDVQLRGCRWNLGSPGPKRFNGDRTRLRIVVTRRFRHRQGHVSFRVVNAAGKSVLVNRRA